MTARPLRFLALVLGGWICVRAAVLSPGWWGGTPAGAPPASPARSAHRPAPGPVRQAKGHAPLPQPSPYLIREAPYKAGRPAAGPAALPVGAVLPVVAPMTGAGPMTGAAPMAVSRRPADSGARSGAEGGAAAATALLPGGPARPLPTLGPSSSRAAGRWSASAWLLVRGDSGRPGLIPGGALGGSQAGARLGYRLGGGVSFSARAYAPLRQPAGAELAAGVAWRPAAAIPVEILAERRQALGAQGRSAFAAAAHGGGSLSLPRGLRLDLYGQAGIVGLRSRDAFAGASARVSAAAGPVEIGAGAWGAAQPGAARLDAGPTLTWRLPVARADLRIEAGWRFRLAGDASPGSGPALILAADF